MRHLYLPILFAASMFTGGLSSCGNDNESVITFDSVTVDRDVKLANGSKSPECKMHISLLFAENSNGAKAKSVNNVLISKAFGFEKLAFKQAADSFANKYTSDYKTNLFKLYQADKSNKRAAGWYDYNYVLTCNTEKGKKNVIIYSLNLQSYEGGAHGICQTQIFDFDTRTGKQITISDLFVPGYEVSLNELLLKALEDKTGSRNLDDLHNKSYLMSCDMYPSENFKLYDDEITFVYNPYEIAPYAIGTIELTLSNSDLNKILKKQ